MPLLEVRDLRTSFFLEGGEARAVDGVSFALDAGRVLGLVGESGCGKSVTALSLMRLVPPPGRIVGGEVRLDGRDLLGLPEREMRAVRGAGLAMIFQEPITALDVTIQAEILDLLRALREQRGMALLLITHDLGVVAEQADEVAIMYAGRIVEHAPVLAIFDRPLHPYTQGLFRSIPGISGRHDRLEAIPGQVPDLLRLPSGCTFRDRCPQAIADCAGVAPPLEEHAPGHRAACIRL